MCPLLNGRTEAQSGSVCLSTHSSSGAKPGLEPVTLIPVYVTGSMLPPTPACWGESLLLPFPSGFFLETKGPEWERTAFLNGRINSAKCRVGIWMPGRGGFLVKPLWSGRRTRSVQPG